MGRNLVVCCDGTGNIWGGGGDTNVVLLIQALHKDANQLVFYDPGVGSATNLPSISPWERIKVLAARLWGLAFGQGIYENILQAYAFLVQHYRTGDQIYVFGFSRGAFTARCVAGMVNLFGVIRCGGEAMLPSMVRLYFSAPGQANGAGMSRQDLANELRSNFCVEGADARVHFIGVWDTVESVGGLRSKSITSAATVKGKAFDHVRQALALDELRAPYKPRVYDEANFDTGIQSLQQRWYPGAHCDVGGSYPQRGLSNATLRWMLEQAQDKGLALHSTALERIVANSADLAHNQAFSLPLWALLGLRRRIPPEGAAMDPSVAAHAASGRSVWCALWRCPDFWTSLLASALLMALYWTVLGPCADGAEAEGCGSFGRRLRWATVVDFGLIAAYIWLLCRLNVAAWRWLDAGVPGPRGKDVLSAVAQWPLLALLLLDLAENGATLLWLRACERAEARCDAWGQGVQWLTTGKFVALAAVALFLLAGFAAWVVHRKTAVQR